MTLKRWPAEFFAKKAGDGCPQCLEGRPADTDKGVRWLEGEYTDVYLRRTGPTPGYSVAVFRGRHVDGPQSMTPDEHRSFWADISSAARSIEAVFAPVHLNFQLLGNADPHVHVHIVPRYDPDPAPGMPLPAASWEASTVVEPLPLEEQLERLRALVPDMNMVSYTESAAGLSADDLVPFFAGWPDPPTLDRRLAILTAASEVIVARSDDGTVIGFVTAVTDGTFAAFVPLIEVQPTAQGRGVGAELMRRMIARLSDYYSIDLVCDDDVAPFYDSVGGLRLNGFGWRDYGRLDP